MEWFLINYWIEPLVSHLGTFALCGWLQHLGVEILLTSFTKMGKVKDTTKSGAQKECIKPTELTIAKTNTREAQRVTFQPELEVIVENPKSSHPVIITKVKLKVKYSIYLC